MLTFQLIDKTITSVECFHRPSLVVSHYVKNDFSFEYSFEIYLVE